MEVYRKRQRIHPPQQSEFPESFGNQYVYYVDDDRDELDGYEFDDEEEDYRDEEMMYGDPDADSEFEQKRAQVDLKLKSTYESIFEKYGRDFDGIGDEIDMETGEIVVNNGHLAEMLDERDVGEDLPSRRRYESTEESTELVEEFESSGEDQLMDEKEVHEEEDGGTDEKDSEDDTMEDDLILRGFAQATRGRTSELNPSQPQALLRHRNELRDHHVAPIEPVEAAMPSRSQIIAQFGPQVGPQILEVILQQNVRKENESNIEEAWQIPIHLDQRQGREMGFIEPAWRTPVIPNGRPKPRPVVKSNMRLEKYDQSPSPERGTSLWKSAVLEPKKAPPGHGKLKKPPAMRAVRNSFTADDDETLLDCVRKARQSGKELDGSFFQGLGAQYPRHSALGWRHRYKIKYAYLGPEGVEESDSTDSDELLRPVQVARPRQPRIGLEDSVRYRQPPSANYQQPRPAAIKPPYSRPAINDHQPPNRMSGRGPRPRRRNSTDVSWSQALSTIKHVDPSQYAGIIVGSRPDGELSRSFFDGSSVQRRENRRISDQIPNFSQKSYREDTSLKHEMPRRRYSDSTHGSKVGNYDLRTSQNSSNRIRRVSGGSISSASCPHVECRNYPTISYRLQRRIEDEQSQMSLHLLNVHHTTPYPCEEVDCNHKGENGYSVQVDLVEHVRSAHPQIEALQRLRGRVDPSLLGKGTEWQHNQILGRPGTENAINICQEVAPNSPPRAPGSVVPSSSQLLSSSSDLDQIVTSRGITSAPTYTPLTSVSSLVANPPSDKSDIGMRDMNDRSSIPNIAPDFGHSRISKARSLGSSRQRSITEEQQLPKNNFGSPDLSLPLNGIQQSFSSTAGILGSDNFGSVEPLVVSLRQHNVPQTPSTGQNFTLKASPPSSIPDSQTSFDHRPQGLSQTDVLGHSSGDVFNANDEGSERENHPPRPKWAPQTAMLPPSKVKPNFARELYKTPSFRKSTRRSFPPGGRGTDEEDELNLASDGFVLLSARSKVGKPPVNQLIHMKRENTSDISQIVPLIPAASKKRKLELFQDDDEIDELMADEPSYSISRIRPSARKQARVKEEDTEHISVLPPAIPTGRKIKKSNQRKGICQPRSAIAEFSAARCGHTPSAKRTTFGRAETPLLDLTPTRNTVDARNMMREIAESGAESSSQPEPLAAGSSSPLNNLLTPVRRTRAIAIKQEGPLIVMRTPGGTLRGCGDHGFACKSVFCLNSGCKAKKSAVGKQ